MLCQKARKCLKDSRSTCVGLGAGLKELPAANIRDQLSTRMDRQPSTRRRDNEKNTWKVKGLQRMLMGASRIYRDNKQAGAPSQGHGPAWGCREKVALLHHSHCQSWQPLAGEWGRQAEIPGKDTSWVAGV